MRTMWMFMFVILFLVSPQAWAGAAESLKYQSPFVLAEFAPDRPALTALAVDSLGKGKLDGNLLLSTPAAAATFEVRREGEKVEY